MRSSIYRPIVPFLVRGAIVALLVMIATGLLSGPAGFGAAPQSAEAALLSEVKKLLASDAQTLDNFGISVAVSGDTAVVGAWHEDAGGLFRAGAAYVFQRGQGGAGNWGEVTKLTASDAQADDGFGYSVAVSGDTAVVGAIQEDPVGTDAGAAYVFQRDQGGTNNWGEVKKLTASDAQAFDIFGYSVAVSGDTAVVGAFREDAGGSNAGAAYVFQRNEGGADNWGEVTKLTASDAGAGDLFGYSVAVSGDTAIVGAYQEDAGGTDAGAAYVFERNEGGAGNWGELKKLTASDAQAGDIFGVSVAVSGDTAVVGAFWEDAGGSDAGAAYVFQRDQGGTDDWGEVKKLIASDAGGSDFFGVSVAVSGDTAIVGAYGENAGDSQAGAAYVFGRNQGGMDNWGEVTKLTASDAQAGDWFGFSVAVSGVAAVVGAPLEDAGGSNAGAAYVFHPPCPDNDGDTLCDAADPDDDNDGLPDFYEATHSCLDPLVDDAAADPDGDGWLNSVEFNFGTNPCVANAVGGIAELPEVAGTPLETDGSSGGSLGVLAGIAAGTVAGILAFGGAAWYARRRWVR